MYQDYLDQFVTDWFAMLAYCNLAEFDRKQFKVRHDFWAKKWARLKWDDQGYITERISHGIKLVPPNPALWDDRLPDVGEADAVVPQRPRRRQPVLDLD